MGIHTMTEVQRMTLNECLDGSDVIAQARTGTGKTLAFLMPIVQRLLRSNPELEFRSHRNRANAIDIRALIISPTRELAEQIATEANKIVFGTAIKVQRAVGGTGRRYHLSQMHHQGCHILVGTPGRVKDLLSDPSSGVSLDNIETFVLDEADRLLDIGFAPEIEEIQTHMPPRSSGDRQTLMFSATVPKSVVQLVRKTLRPDFKFVRTVDPNEAPTHANIPQRAVFLPGLQNQIPAIVEIAMNAIDAHQRDPANNLPFKAIVYLSSINEVALTANVLQNLRDPNPPASARSVFAPHPLEPCKIIQISSRLGQVERTRNAESFRRAESAILVSSDVTARGMDFPNVSHVIQIGLPKSLDDYVHRLGRTGRAGKSGEGWLLLNHDDRHGVRRIMSDNHINLQDDQSLHSATLDMTKPAQLPARTARLLQMVEKGIRAVPWPDKAKTYASLLSVLQQQNTSRGKQTIIDLANELARYGWGLEKPPALSRALVQKLGFSRCDGIEIDDTERAGGHGGRGRPLDRRDGRGGRRADRFDERDPFGQGASGGRGAFGGGFAGASRGRDSGRQRDSFRSRRE